MSCNCRGICNTRACPCVKSVSSCGDNCGCTSDRCKNQRKSSDIRGFFQLPSNASSEDSSAPCIPNIPNHNSSEDNVNSSAQQLSSSTCSTQPSSTHNYFPFIPPEPRKKVSEVNGKQHWPSDTNNHYELNTFSYYDGKCSCGCMSMICDKNTKAVKAVLCNGRPRFMQSLSLKCPNCNKTTMAYEKSYVDTLSPTKKRELNAIITGRSHGIDMSLVRQLRNGSSAEEVENTARANLYDDWNCCKQQYETAGLGQDFPPFPEKYVPKAEQLINAFLRDVGSERIWLKRELAAMKSSTALAIDCQVKVIKKRVKKGVGMGNACQALSIAGDFGIILSHVVVPSDMEKYRVKAMEEVVSRHEMPPKFCYVDTNCCNGKPGGRTEDTKMYHGMEKKLDSTHLLMRIGEVVNPVHNRAAAFMRKLSEKIFSSNGSDLIKLGLAVDGLSSLRGLSSLSPEDRKCEHVRRHIRSGTSICSGIISVVLDNALIDKNSMDKYEGSYTSNAENKIITPSHYAYPLITIQVWQIIKQQLIHIANGCLSDDGEDMNTVLRHKKYKYTHTMLPVYTSLRGTSKIEAFQSFMASKSREWNQIRPELYDARTLWLVTHYNRKRLRNAGRKALPDGVSPSEAGAGDVILASIEDGKKVKFGFEYHNSVKGLPVELIRNKGKKSTRTYASNHKSNYNLLEDIRVPDKVGMKDIDRIGEVLEQALPDVSMFGDATKRANMSVPSDLIEQCTESLAEYNQHPVSHVYYPKVSKEVDDHSFTRSTASSLTTDIDITGDVDILQRQRVAQNNMVKNQISIERDAKEPGRRYDNNCKVCFKRKSTFTFQGRRHLQKNRAEKGAKLEWHCPLADPPEQYFALLEKRNELKRRRDERYTKKKREAKRQKN